MMMMVLVIEVMVVIVVIVGMVGIYYEPTHFIQAQTPAVINKTNHIILVIIIILTLMELSIKVSSVTRRDRYNRCNDLQ